MKIGYGPDLRPSLGRCCQGVCVAVEGSHSGVILDPRQLGKYVAAPLRVQISLRDALSCEVTRNGEDTITK